MKTFKLQIKKCLLIFISFPVMGITAICAPAFNTDDTKASSRPGPDAKSPRLINAKTPDSNRFFYDFPFSSNLGIRFKNYGKIKSDVYEGLRWNSDQPGRGNSFRSIIIDGGQCGVELCSLDINEQNAGDYRYRVVKNFNEGLAPWIRPSVFKASNGSQVKYAYLGHFEYAPGQVLKVEIYDIKYNGLQDAIRICWKKIVPATLRGFIQFVSVGLHYPPDKLASVEINLLKKSKGKYQTNFIETSSAKNIKFRLGDSLQNLNFYVGSDWPRFYNYKVILTREIRGRTDSLSIGETNPPGANSGGFGLNSFDLSKVYWDDPGIYKITFIPKIISIGGQPAPAPEKLAASISFTILPENTFRRRVSVITLIVVALAIISIAAIAFIYYRVRQRTLLAREIQNRKTATLQLQSIRSQLNPHFIFNALAGIQNLMNKNEVENANKYLARFARLTRNVLDDGQKELIPIEHEIELLTDYLQMEQLRFRFNFSITAAKDVDRQIEIPAMLLQPFAENAVKHGVSALKNKGEIVIGIFKNDNSLRLVVQDNGKGFSNSNPAGMGIRLCEDRIRLLNSIYKNTAILLVKSSGKSGTLITIELNNWL